jgi:putative protein-disulfide isomerase
VKALKENLRAKKANSQEAGQVKITFYTDPLCCWSWAFEQHWQKLLHDFDGCIQYQYVLCGMIPDWKTYEDPMNAVSNPLQMGPVWMHASEVTRVKMKYSIWHEDPPTSSYPSCIAVKTAGLQSQAAEAQMLLHMRKALMEDGMNISKPDVLMRIAEKMGAETGIDFNYERFKQDWRNGKGQEPFRNDLQKARFHQIGRYPTLTMQNLKKDEGVILVGYRPYEVLTQVFKRVIDAAHERE